MGGVALDSSGNLFGTTDSGGATGNGTVFEVAQGSGTITTLASFDPTANGPPLGGAVVLDSSDNLYGTTEYGGVNGSGSVFEIANESNTITTLMSFNGSNGFQPLYELALDKNGNLYGTTFRGGTEWGDSGVGAGEGLGTVFEIGAGSHAFSLLASFDGANGENPEGVAIDASGNLYGETSKGGMTGGGTLFEIGAGNHGFTTLLTFNLSDGRGSYPEGGLAIDSSGNLFGTTALDGASDGTVFEVAADSDTVTPLVIFDNGEDGIEGGSPASIHLDNYGDLYGVTLDGGVTSSGSVFIMYSLSAPRSAAVVTGNGQSIINGSSTPSANNATDVGSVAVGAVSVTTYTIANNGNIPLTLGTVTVPVGFTLVSAPESSVPAGSISTFSVGMNTSSDADFSGNISIPTNDTINNPYTFAIYGAVGPSAISVTGTVGIIANGSTTPSAANGTEFATVFAGGFGSDETYTISNDGTGTLDVGTVTLPTGFTLDSPLQTTVDGGDTASFTVDLDESGNLNTGTYSGKVSIPSNGPNNKLYTFEVTGKVLPNATPPENPAAIIPDEMIYTYNATDTNGQGQTIAVVDPYNDPTAEQDLDVFSEAYDLPLMNQAGGPTFTQINQKGGSPLPAPANASWGTEISMDIEWAHVMAPEANILLVEATSNSGPNLLSAVDTARNFPGVSVVSISWGSPETSADLSHDYHFTTPAGHNGVTFVASSGDKGESADPAYPAVSPNVVAVGGTILSFDDEGDELSDTGWTQSGGGISQYEPQPEYQVGTVTQSTTKRTIPDVAMDAGTPVSIYDSYNFGTINAWRTDDGTSLGAPMFAALIADADQGRVTNGLKTLDGPSQTLPLLYTMGPDYINDITTGNNGYAAGPGYDLVTGLGSPFADSMILALEVPLASVAVSGNGHAVADRATSTSTTNGTNFGVSPIGTTAPQQTFTITNVGDEALTVGTVTLPAGFTLITAPAGSVAVGGSTTFTVALVNTATGTYSGKISFATNDPIRNPYTFEITGTVTPALPNIASLTTASVADGLGAVTRGNSLTLTAQSVLASAPTAIKLVDFYSSTSSTFSTTTAKLIGVGMLVIANTYALMISTVKLSPGTYTFFVRALDSLGRYGAAVMATAVVNDDPPHIISLAVVSPIHPAADNKVALRAIGVSDPYDPVTIVNFYWNPAGAPAPGSGTNALANAVLLGTATAKTGWTLTATLPSAADSTNPFPPSGPVTFVAQANDTLNTLGNLVSVTAIAAAQPTIGSLAVTPSAINPAQSVIFTAGDIADTGLPGIPGVTAVEFWLAPAGSTTLDTLTDTLLGSGAKQLDGDWTLTLRNFSRFAVGDYVVFANVKDRNGNWSEGISQAVTVL